MMWAAGNDSEYAIEDCSRLRSCIYKYGVHGSVAYTVFGVNSTVGTKRLGLFCGKGAGILLAGCVMVWRGMDWG